MHLIMKGWMVLKARWMYTWVVRVNFSHWVMSSSDSFTNFETANLRKFLLKLRLFLFNSSLKAEAFINVVILVIIEMFATLFHPFQILKIWPTSELGIDRFKNYKKRATEKIANLKKFEIRNWWSHEKLWKYLGNEKNNLPLCKKRFFL